MGNTQNTYPLEWVDLLTNFTLNPTRTNLSAITKAQVDVIILEHRKKVASCIRL